MDHSKSSQQENGCQTKWTVGSWMDEEDEQSARWMDADVGDYILPLGPYFQT